MAGMYSYQAGRSASSAPAPPASLPMQKKILDNVLECAIQLKTDFFEDNQPITDDSIVLQRFCAKFEHFLQIGMKEKVSLLGRKKDYWDYICDCLGSSKGINDGIKYVKSLGENKTSLGKGRAFIRFCLVHQRLADMMQQCVVNEKTNDWFVPGTLMTDSKECQRLINSLYDLNSLHFDLSPRGYDLDTSWPAFSNRKHAGSGSWNVPLSRRSSMTSMDAISNISVSVDNNAEVDRLAKDLESAQSAKSELVGQIGALQQEKAQVSQSAWATHGELQASQQQLRELQAQLAELQAKYQELDVSHVKLKLEKEYLERAHADELKTVNAKYEEESGRRVSQLAAEEEVWKKERKEEAGRMQREVDKLAAEVEEAKRRADAEQARAEEQSRILQEMLSEADIKAENGDFRTSLSSLVHTVKDLQLRLSQLTEEKSLVQNQLQGEQTDKGKQLSLLEGRLLEQEKALREVQDSSAGLQMRATKLELELKGEQEKASRLEQEKSCLENKLREQETELKGQAAEFGELKVKVSELELKNVNLATERDYLKLGTEKTEALSSEIKGQLETAKAELVKANTNAEKSTSELNKKCKELSAQIESAKEEIASLQTNVREKEVEIETLKKSGQGERSEMQDQLKKGDEELGQVKAKLDETMNKLDVISKEAAELGEGNLVLSEKHAMAEAELETLRKGCREVEDKVVNLEGEVEKMILESREKDAKLSEVNSQNDLLRQEMEEKSKALESMSSQAANLDQEMKGMKQKKEEELGTVREELATVRSEKEELRRDMDVEKERLLGLLKESEGVKRSESEKEEKISSLILELESLRREKEMDVTQLEERARVLNSQINERDERVSELSKEVESLSSQVANVKTAHGKLEVKAGQAGELEAKLHSAESRFKELIARMDAQTSEERRLRENEAASFTERIKWLETQLADREKSHNASCNDYEAKISKLKEAKDELESSSSEVSESLARLTGEVSTLSEDKALLSSKLDTAESERQQLQSQSAELSQQLTDIRTQLEKAGEDNESLKTQVETMAEDLTHAENARDELERQAVKMKEQLQAAEDEAQDKLSQKREVELKLDEVELKLEEAELKWKRAESKLDEAELEQQTFQESKFSAQVLEESLVEARKTLEGVRSERSQLQDKFDQVSSQKDELQRRLDAMEGEKKEMYEQIDEMSKQLSSSDQSDMERLSEQLDEERKKSKTTIETLNEEISALQFQLSAEQMQKNETQGDNSSMAEERNRTELRAVISDQEIIIERLEQELEAAQESHQADSSQVSILERKVDKTEESLKSAENRLAQTSSRLEQEIDERRKLEAELTSIRTTFSKSLEDKTTVIKNLESDNAQYKKKLIKLIRDKDTLWHKTDELVTAQKRKSEERWQDNAEVTHCLHCKAEFSLFVRKHHCRLCGRIFCWSCSDCWLDSTLSSKKVRCCKPCFDSHSEGGADQLSASMVANESDDDEEDEEEDGAEGKDGEEASGADINHEVSDAASSSSSSKPAGVVSSTHNQTDEFKVKERASSSILSSHDNESLDDDTEGNIYDTFADNEDDDVEEKDGGLAQGHRSIEQAPGNEENNTEDVDIDEGDGGSNDSNFQVVSQEEIEKSMSRYSKERTNSAAVPPNMSSSMILSAEDLESGEVNQQNEVWVKPGKTYVVPVDIAEKNTVLHWSFTSSPKDIVFSVTYRSDDSVELSDAEEIVAPCKCESHKQTVRGELTAKQPGVYSLVFDNTYSRLTSKKVHYRLDYKKDSG